ncbi:aldolase [Bacillus songklensis]|uniref:Aldolase n=1 Tax=Bacillus songklensis TaxID=1069116 RepID=A0ABV8B6F6_9BACI
MLKAKKKVVYKAFGLSVTSEISLPELPHMGNKVDSIDIEIKIEDLSELWFELSNKKNRFVINENLVMFQIPNIATFSIQEGKRISVLPMKEDEEDMIRLYILGTCMGVILMQRKIFPLHGSAVAINGKAYAIIGDSGVGKSTLASGFLNQGYRLLSDDVIAVSLSHDDYIPFVTPSYPQQKLWEDSLNNFGMKTSHYQSICRRENKYCVPVPSKYFPNPLPLAGVFELVKTENEKVEIHPIEKLERLRTLFCHTYRNFLIPRLGLMDWHFHTSATILNKVDVYQLRRPVSRFSAPQLVSLILNTVNKGE